MKINGYVKYKYDEKIRFDTFEKEILSTDLVVKTTHVGLSKGDIFIMENAWKGTVYPQIGTSESIGIVEQVGNETKGFIVGDRVGVGYILNSCMECEYCKNGEYQYCESQKNTEIGGYGGLGEKLVVDYRLVAKIPNSIDSIDATPLMCYGVTAYSGIKKADLEPKSKVAVIGFGGLGHIIVKLLVAMGHEVTVFSHTTLKEKVVKDFGAKSFILTTAKNWSKGLNKYFDLIINASPANFNFSDYVVLLRAKGKMCYLGLPFNKQTFSTPKLADYGSRIVFGSYVGSTKEIEALLRFVALKEISPETIAFPITELDKAMKLVKKGIPYKRVVLKW